MTGGLVTVVGLSVADFDVAGFAVAFVVAALSAGAFAFEPVEARAGTTARSVNKVSAWTGFTDLLHAPACPGSATTWLGSGSNMSGIPPRSRARRL